MSWRTGSFWDGVVAHEKGALVKLYNPETEATVSMELVLADLGSCVAFIEENEPVEATKPQDAGICEEEAQNPVAPEIQSEAGICEEPKKRRGGRRKKQAEKPAEEKPAKEKGRRPADKGKIRALYEAKWSIADIASDTHQTEETVKEVLGI